MCDVLESRYGDLKFSEKIRPINENKQTLKVISLLKNILDGSIKAQIEGLDVNFYISNKGVYTLDVELRYAVLKF